MTRPIALVTGAGGEMGRLLLPALARRGFDLVAMDLNPLDEKTAGLCLAHRAINLLDTDGVADLLRRYHPERIFHLAAILSAHAERDPERAHRVNVEGTLSLFRLCRDLAEPATRFLFPSSIAVYGLPDRETKGRQGALEEWQWTEPRGVYGCNKLYCEHIGHYLSQGGLDFRAIRFPGLISAETLPSGGTTDYGPEMIHAAARGQPYACFVEEGSRLPFMTMPDAIEAFLTLAEAPASRLTRRVYNIRGFSASAGELRAEVLRHFPRATITFDPNAARQRIVDSWPEDVNDAKARRDWGLDPRHGLAEAFADYLVPALGAPLRDTARGA
jgi:threonine 3-dehydrogenase